LGRISAATVFTGSPALLVNLVVSTKHTYDA
jgi:hypothetical protein